MILIILGIAAIVLYALKTVLEVQTNVILLTKDESLSKKESPLDKKYNLIKRLY
jgi:hypothetical protein